MNSLSRYTERLHTNASNKKRLIPLFITALAALITISSPVYASDYSAQIQSLQNQNADKQTSLENLKTAALPLQQKIDNLQATIDGLTKLINDNQAARDKLTGSIASLDGQIAGQRQILKDSVRQMYIQGDMSTVEMLATSKNLSDYVDKEQYTLLAQTKVKKGMDKINNLENEQKKQKKQADQLIADNQKMQSQVSAQKDQVNQLLSQNQAQQDSASQDIASNNAQISDLEKKQAAENASMLASLSVPSGGGGGASVTVQSTPSNILDVDGTQYPWANAPWPNDIPDPWGMDERQCVSYTAWAVSASGRHMPYWGGSGNAKQWPADAEAAGIAVDSNPRAGDVAISTAGTYGHAMYVNSVNSDGTLNISQYNADWTGTYSTARINPGSLVFIHF